MSRPEAKIDWKIVDKLLEGGADGVQVAAHFGIHPETFYKRVQDEYGIGFSVYAQEKRSKGDALLHMAQFNKAIKGDSQMLKHLGEFRLGQKGNNREDIEVLIKGLFDDIREREAKIGKGGNLIQAIEPNLETQQPILDQGSTRQEGEVRDELGPTGAL